jgi:hypothetical protein
MKNGLAGFDMFTNSIEAGANAGKLNLLNPEQ